MNFLSTIFCITVFFAAETKAVFLSKQNKIVPKIKNFSNSSLTPAGRKVQHWKKIALKIQLQKKV